MADQATQRATIAASPETLFSVVTDFEHYPQWARDLKHVEVVGRDDDGLVGHRLLPAWLVRQP